MLARAQTPHIFVPKSPIAFFFSKPRAKIRLFMRVSVEKLTKKQHNFLLDKKLCCLIVSIVSIDAIDSIVSIVSIDAIVSIFLFSQFKTPLRRCPPLASGSNRSACALE